MFQRLLVCTDLSDGLQRFATFVPQFAHAGVQHITLLHCVPLLQERSVPKEDSARVAQASSQLKALLPAETGIDVQVQVKSGRPIDLILHTAHTQHCDLIILGTPTRNALAEKLIGNTLIEVAKRADVPLLLLRPQIVVAFTAEELSLRCQHLFRDLLVPYDDSPTARFVIEQIQQIAQANQDHTIDKLHLCWAVEGLRRRDLPLEAELKTARTVLERVKANLDAANLGLEPVTVEVRQGDPVLELFLASQTVDVSAIAISSDSLGKLSELSAPSFARELMRRSWYPLLYFPLKR